MKLVLLTGEGVEHDYVAGGIASAFGEELSAIVVVRTEPEPLLRRVGRYRRRYGPSQIASRIGARLYRTALGLDGRRQETLRRVLGSRRPAANLYRHVPGHNGPECLKLLERIEPDIIAVYGTGIIREPVCARARLKVLNMHTGLSPRYRGSDTIFWPLHNEEPEWVGVTVHELTQGIDAGPILATGRPTIEAGDDEDTLFAKSVMVGTELFVEAIRSVHAGTSVETVQDEAEGRQYRFVDRTVAAERRVAALIRGGLLRRYVDGR